MFYIEADHMILKGNSIVFISEISSATNYRKKKWNVTMGKF